ncbi:hypothetical protein FD755_006249 [Muntiacus reevesi]|uniref:inositol-polyphosphate 5-phosphatase n=1 Tax=Muntiacus reevesi TaxID=9886 RepID=A0A5J5MY50_MUNRE|nr:hypothetical protein FD755_006249 [Muntiacus reevesi]
MPLTVWITTNCGEFLRDGNTRPPDLPPEKPVHQNSRRKLQRVFLREPSGLVLHLRPPGTRGQGCLSHGCPSVLRTSVHPEDRLPLLRSDAREEGVPRAGQRAALPGPDLHVAPKKYKKVTGKEIYSDTLESTPMLEKEKFPQDYFPECKWSRKGFLRTRWCLADCAFDLVNIHLFHDASNLVAWETSPSVYSGIRHKALGYVLDRIIDQRFEKASYFVFGDFNFRLDSKSVVETLCTKATMQTVRAADTNEVVKLIFRESDNDRKVMLQLEKKLFDYFNQEVFRDDNGTALLEFDKELSVFKDRLYELDISFPPSYPYSEDCSQGRQYMNTRCPAWCDRVLMSPSAKELILRVSEAGGPAGGGLGGGRPGGSLLPPVVLGLGCSPGSGVKTA